MNKRQYFAKLFQNNGHDGQYSEISDEKWTDNNGQTEHVFEHEAILNIDVSIWVGTNELTGNNVIRLLKNKTVTKTVAIY